jgi:hypothetical protein
MVLRWVAVVVGMGVVLIFVLGFDWWLFLKQSTTSAIFDRHRPRFQNLHPNAYSLTPKL